MSQTNPNTARSYACTCGEFGKDRDEGGYWGDFVDGDEEENEWEEDKI